MVREAGSHAEEDQRRREEIEARNRADSLIYTTEKTLQESKDKIPAEDARAVTEALEAARKAVQELTRASHRMAEVLYQRSSSAGPSETGGAPKPEGGKGGDDVVDAEVVDKS